MRHSLEACAGTGSRDATDVAQPEGMRRTWQQGAADEAQPEGVRRNRQQRRHRCGAASRCALETAAEPPPTRHSLEVCAETGSRAAADKAQPGGVRWRRQQSRHRCGTARRCALEPAAEPPPTRHSLEVRAGTGSRAAADEAQPGGVRRRMPDAASKRAEPMGCTHWEERGSDEDEAHVEGAD